MTEHIVRHEFAIGEKAQLSRTVGDADIWRMAEITGDFNPIHVDEAFAKESRFSGRIAHGMFSAGLISAVLGTKLPGPGAIYLQQTLVFLQPAFAGDILTAEVEVTAWHTHKHIVELSTTCSNGDGKLVLTGNATLLIDTRAQR